MGKYIKQGTAILGGVLYSTLAILLAQWLIRNLGSIAAQIGGTLGLAHDLISQITQSLNQLQDARILMPWLEGILFGVLAGTVFPLAMRRRVWQIVMILLAVVLFLPLTLVAFCLAEVNDIQVGALLKTILPLLINFV